MKDKEMKKKVIVGFELTVMIVSVFAFSYGVFTCLGGLRYLPGNG